MKYKTLKGLQDIYPPEISIWRHVEVIAAEIFAYYGYNEIRLPILESTELFVRSIGETSDIVEKEMYTFQDKGGRSVTLRPEGTASFVRAYVEHHLYNEPSPQKYFYMGPMFRYERPQAHRYRQFYQIGAEAMGIEDPTLDAELISMLSTILSRIGLSGLNFEISSIGCKACRPEYKRLLRDFISERLDSFCSDCKRRLDANPLRILDCKVPTCIESRKGAPPIIDSLCEECNSHFRSLQVYLNEMNIPHTINPNLVRGLDYYTKTAFEVSSESLGSQKAVAAGGRYDGMVAEFGGPDIAGIGFAMGMERIIPLIKEKFASDSGPELFICPLGRKESVHALLIAERLRNKGARVALGHEISSLRSQMRKANRMNARYTLVLGENEMQSKAAELKHMQTGEKTKVGLGVEDIINVISGKSNASQKSQ